MTGNGAPVLPLLLVSCLLFFAGVQVSESQDRKLYPVDEGLREPSFASFRADLLMAIQRRDAKYILKILDPEIELSFGGHRGITDFKQMWHPEQRNSKLWKTLQNVLRMGGSFEKGKPNIFWAPYVFSMFPDGLDAFEWRAVIRKDAPIRTAPDFRAPVIAKLSYDIVEVVREASSHSGESRWLKVRFAGKEGYARREALRSPIDYRACFEKKAGKWLMTFLIAGD